MYSIFAGCLTSGDKLLQFRSDITSACHTAVTQLSRLRAIEGRLDAKESAMLYQVAECMRQREPARGKIFANEVSNIRKLKSRINQSGMQLEAAVIRLSTLADYANLADALNPVAGLLQGIENDLRTVPFAANSAFSEMEAVMAETLSNASLDASEKSAKEILRLPIDDGTISILKEAEDDIEQEVRVKLPQVPIEKPVIAPMAKQSRDDEQLFA